MRELPSGTVTLLFTDVEGSTRLLQELGREAYVRALTEHRRLLREAFTAHGGVEVEMQGDSFHFAFPYARDAVAAAVAGQRALAGHAWETTPIRVRIGLHTGEPVQTEGLYAGLDVHRAARVMGAAHGGQVLLSARTAELVDGELPPGIVLRDLGEHRLKDLSAPQRLFQAGEADFPPLATLGRTNLPVPTTPFLGRRADVAAVVEQLRQPGVRLLTLTGPGGTGKTRLALEAAGAAADAFPDGVTWIPLASLADPALSLPTVARALGLQQDGERPLRDLLEARLTGRRQLLLLDNAEHLLPGVASDVAALAAVDGPTLLVTSRERLQLQGEHVVAVPSLARDDAVLLFLTRAADVGHPLLRSPAVDALCERLDDLPLALELAAARTPLFSPEQLLERVARSLDLLKAARDADPRHQTLRATVRWSYDLLDPAEQALFRRLSVFSGGCGYGAAETVCDAEPDVLQSLIDKSLVRRRDTDGDVRYWMLETVRQLAQELLAESGEAEATGDRHGAWCLDLARTFRSGAGASDAAAAAVEREHDNISAAIDRALRAEDPTLALELVAAVWRLWDERGRVLEGERWVNAALERSAGAAADLRRQVAHAAASFARDRGDFARATALFEEVRALAETSGDESALAAALAQLGRTASLAGDHETALDLIERAVVLRRRGDDRERLGATLHGLGLALIEAGRADESFACLAEADEILCAVESEYGMAVVRQAIGWALLAVGDPRSSLRASVDGLRRFHAIGDTYSVALSVGNVADALVALGAWGDGVRLEAASDALHRRAGYAASAAGGTREREAATAAARAALGDAEYERLLAEGAALDLDAAVELALTLSDVHGASVD